MNGWDSLFRVKFLFFAYLACLQVFLLRFRSLLKPVTIKGFSLFFVSNTSYFLLKYLPILIPIALLLMPGPMSALFIVVRL